MQLDWTLSTEVPGKFTGRCKLPVKCINNDVLPALARPNNATLRVAAGVFGTDGKLATSDVTLAGLDDTNARRFRSPQRQPVAVHTKQHGTAKRCRCDVLQDSACPETRSGQPLADCIVAIDGDNLELGPDNPDSLHGIKAVSAARTALV
jgi:hypothetical protein